MREGQISGKDNTVVRYNSPFRVLPFLVYTVFVILVSGLLRVIIVFFSVLFFSFVFSLSVFIA